MEKMSIKEHPPLHVPVLLDDVIALLTPRLGETYLDLTAGYGGHARAVLARTQQYSGTVLVDRDEFAHTNLSEFLAKGAQLLHTDFVSAARQLIEQGRQFDMILLDLGVSSPQLDRAERGFSFAKSGPLDMRMDRRQSLTAADVVNTWTVERIAQIIRDFGEESPRAAMRYARSIAAARPLETTTDRGPHRRTHPATRVFQAIRIATNDELGQIKTIMPLLPVMLTRGGRVGVISFHSLEDRIVKRYFAEQAAAGYEASLRIITKRPVSGAINDVHNPRSRSAKLRAAVKI